MDCTRRKSRCFDAVRFEPGARPGGNIEYPEHCRRRLPLWSDTLSSGRRAFQDRLLPLPMVSGCVGRAGDGLVDVRWRANPFHQGQSQKIRILAGCAARILPDLRHHALVGGFLARSADADGADLHARRSAPLSARSACVVQRADQLVRRRRRFTALSALEPGRRAACRRGLSPSAYRPPRANGGRASVYLSGTISQTTTRAGTSPSFQNQCSVSLSSMIASLSVSG